VAESKRCGVGHVGQGQWGHAGPVGAGIAACIWEAATETATLCYTWQGTGTKVHRGSAKERGDHPTRATALEKVN
jgi:hypothetical protein